MNYLIIVAGGNGERMKAKQNKIFLKLDNKELIYWTLKAFEENPLIDKIIISAKTHDHKQIKKIVDGNRIKKIIGIIPAEQTRQESVFATLAWLKKKAKKADLIGIHNAVNPFVLHQEIKDVFAAASKFRAALLAYPARDTVKITNGKGLVDHTPLRKFCWYAQTPQVASFVDLFRAFMEAQEKKFIGTDDTQLLGMIGIKPKVIPCSTHNFKITFPEDMVLAKEILPIFRKENRQCLG